MYWRRLAPQIFFGLLRKFERDFDKLQKESGRHATMEIKVDDVEKRLEKLETTRNSPQQAREHACTSLSWHALTLSKYGRRRHILIMAYLI